MQVLSSKKPEQETCPAAKETETPFHKIAILSLYYSYSLNSTDIKEIISCYN